MRFISVYLALYFLLLLGAFWTLWQSGILERIPGVWLAIGILVATGVGLLLAAASRRRVSASD